MFDESFWTEYTEFTVDLYEYPVIQVGGYSETKGSHLTSVPGEHGRFLENIKVWADGSQINGIAFRFTDLTEQTVGSRDGDYQEFKFDAGELITKFSLGNNGEDAREKRRIGWIHFETNKNRTFDPGMTSSKRGKKHSAEVGSGICGGIACESTFDTNELLDLSLFFLKDIEFAKLSGVTYPTLTPLEPGLLPETLDRFTDENTDNAPRDWMFSGTQEVKVSQEWSFTLGLDLYASMTVEAEVPCIAKVSGTFGWSLSASATYKTTQSKSKKLSWKESGTLESGDSISLIAETMHGNINIPYEGTMEVKLKEGKTFKFTVQGEYKGVDYSEVNIRNENV